MALSLAANARIPATANTTSTSNPLTASFTCPSGTKVLKLTIMSAGATARAGGAPTYNSVSLTQRNTTQGASTGYETGLETWDLINPTTGSSLTISIPNTSGHTLWAYVEAIDGGGSNVEYDTSAAESYTGTSTDRTVSITTGAAGCYISAAVSTGDNTWSPTGQTGTSIYNDDVGSGGSGLQYYVKSTAGAQDMSWTGDTTGDDVCMIAVSYKPASASGYTLTAGAGSYTLTGQAAGLRAARKLTAGSGNYALTGQTVGLRAARKLAAGAGGYTLTGQTAGLRAARKLAAGVGSYTLTGQAAALRAARKLTAGSGSYTLTGQAAALRVARILAAGAGSYTLTGADVTITYSGGGVTHYTLTAESGSYTLTGQSAALRAMRRMTAATGSYTLTGQDAQLLVARLLRADYGSYTLTGSSVTITVGYAVTPIITLTVTARNLAMTVTARTAALTGGDRMAIAYPPSTPVTGTIYYVSTTGSATGTGAITDPLDITTALGSSSPAAAGDAIYLLGGTYSPTTVGATGLGYLDGTAVAGKGVVRCMLNGAVGSKILVRNMPGQDVRVNAGLHVISGQASHVRFWGIEFAPTPTTRTYTDLIYNEVGQFYVSAPGVDFVNCYIHDYNGSVFYYPTAGGNDAGMHGCVCGRMGIWQTNIGRGRGYSLYTHNAGGGTINIKKNAWVGGFNGWNIGAEGASNIRDFYIQDNLMFHGAVLLGGSNTSNDDNNHVDNNYIWNPPYLNWGSGMSTNGFQFVGFNNLNGDGEGLEASYNYIYSGGLIESGGHPLILYYPRQSNIHHNTFITRLVSGVVNYNVLYDSVSSSITNLTVDNNAYYNGGYTTNNLNYRYLGVRRSFATWQSVTGLDANSTQTDGVPTTNVVRVIDNDYENGRGFIGIYNWEGASSVTVNIEQLNITDGARCRLRNVLNMDEYVDFTYSANSPTITISMLAADWSRTEPTAYDVPDGIYPRVWSAAPYPAFGIWQVETLDTGTPMTVSGRAEDITVRAR